MSQEGDRPYYNFSENDPRYQAQLEAHRNFTEASKRRDRARVVIGSVDVTEDVVSILDSLTDSLDWGSGFLSEDEVNAVLRLSRLLNVDVPVGLESF